MKIRSTFLLFTLLAMTTPDPAEATLRGATKRNTKKRSNVTHQAERDNPTRVPVQQNNAKTISGTRKASGTTKAEEQVRELQRDAAVQSVRLAVATIRPLLRDPGLTAADFERLTAGLRAQAPILFALQDQPRQKGFESQYNRVVDALKRVGEARDEVAEYDRAIEKAKKWRDIVINPNPPAPPGYRVISTRGSYMPNYFAGERKVKALVEQRKVAERKVSNILENVRTSYFRDLVSTLQLPE